MGLRCFHAAVCGFKDARDLEPPLGHNMQSIIKAKGASFLMSLDGTTAA